MKMMEIKAMVMAMHNSKQRQKGGVTILLVALVGIATMVATAALAYSINNKKEVSAAAHAQTNAQMMAWAGTSAFFDYIKAKGALGIDIFKAMSGTSVTLKSGVQEVVAKNITITGACTVDKDPCTLSADISASNSASKAANTISVVYEMKVQNGTVIAVAQSKASFGGDTTIDGVIESETPGSEVELNVKGGDVVFNTGAKIGNISKLTLNAEGNVTIICDSITNPDSVCNDADLQTMDINAGGYIRITDSKLSSGKFGHLTAKNYIYLYAVKSQNLSAIKYVELSGGANVDNIKAGTDVTLNGGAGALRSSAKNIEANGDVTVSWSTAEDVSAKGNVTVTNGADVKSIWSNKNVKIDIVGTQVAGNIKAKGNVDTRYASIKGVTALGDINLGINLAGSGVTADGDVYAGGNVDVWYGSKVKNVTAVGQVKSGTWGVALSGGKVSGVTKAKGLVKVYGQANFGDIFTKTSADVYGTWLIESYAKDICAPKTSDITTGAAGGFGIGSKKSENSGQCSFLTPVAPTWSDYAGVDTQAIADAVDAKFNFNNNVDVRVYKNEANYMFVKSNGVSRVFLNKLKNPANGNLYSYDASDGKQYVTISGTKTLVGDGGGYFVGKYTMSGTQKYVGAICESVASGSCTSDILAYIPRVSAEDKPFGNNFESLGYGTPLSVPTWYIRTFFDDSNIDNASIAPGIFYFEGDLKIHGNPNWKADPTSNAYTDTFLAEGDISAVLSSPKIFSPYNILRQKPDASIICNRSYKAADGTVFSSAPSTSPSTIGTKYLVPTNLCKNDTTFAYDMDKVPGTNNKDIVVIDSKNIVKLDLGYVALMSNKDIEVGECSQIFGDVLARGKIYASQGCGITKESQAITGSITTQGQSSQLENRILGGAKYVIPKAEFNPSAGGTGTGTGSGSGSGTGSGAVLDPGSIKMIWAKSL